MSRRDLPGSSGHRVPRVDHGQLHLRPRRNTVEERRAVRSRLGRDDRDPHRAIAVRGVGEGGQHGAGLGALVSLRHLSPRPVERSAHRQRRVDGKRAPQQRCVLAGACTERSPHHCARHRDAHGPEVVSAPERRKPLVEGQVRVDRLGRGLGHGLTRTDQPGELCGFR